MDYFLFPFALYTKEAAITSNRIFYLSLHSLLFNNNFKSKYIISQKLIMFTILWIDVSHLLAVSCGTIKWQLMEDSCYSSFPPNDTHSYCCILIIDAVQVFQNLQGFKHYNKEHANFFLPFVLCLLGFSVIISPLSTCCAARALLFPGWELFAGDAVLNIPATGR